MARLREILSAANKKLKEVSEEKERLEERLNQLKNQRNSLTNIQEAILGLERTKKEKNSDEYFDPGKYGPAYFYCSGIGNDNIWHSEKPSLKEKCPSCEKRVLVLMYYAQTYDSPDYDEWTKTAFTVCVCGCCNEIKSVSRNRRFL